MKRTALALLVLAGTAGTAAPASAGGGCHRGGPSDQDAVTTVKIDHACFLPGAALVAPGASLRFLNDSGLDHNVGGPGITFFDLPNGSDRSITFAAPGLYPYACTLHPGMAGVVVVGAPPSAPAAAVAPVASTTDSGNGSAAPWVAGGAAALLVAGVTLGTFARRARGVPLPAR